MGNDQENTNDFEEEDADYEFVYGVKSWDNLIQLPACRYTMNDFEIGYNKLTKEYSLGIETSQIIVVFIVLILSYIVQTFFRFSKRDWTLVMSSFVIGVVLPMIIQSEIWNR